MITEEEIKQKEKELNQLKSKLENQKAKKFKEEEARNYFDKNFEMNMSHNMYAIEEYWGQFQERFVINSRLDDNQYNDRLLMEYREEYVVLVKNELKILQDQHDLLAKELKEHKENQK